MKIEIKKKNGIKIASCVATDYGEGIYITINDKTIWLHEDSEGELVICAWNTETNINTVINIIPHFITSEEM